MRRSTARRGAASSVKPWPCSARRGPVVPATVGVVTFLNPLRQKSQSGQFMRLASLDVLPDDGTPRKVPVIADRTDAWNTYPAEPIGAVFLRRTGAKVTALQVICPHAGCSINFEAPPRGQVLLPVS